MPKIEWDKSGEKILESGVDHAVLYTVDDETKKYTNGVAWNGITGITESPSGADPNDFYADNIKYASLRAAETFGGTIEAYTYPDEWMACDGSISLLDGVTIGQQARNVFGLSYRTKVTDDLGKETYKTHLIYGATASPSEKGYTTINDSPDANTFSWEMTTNPVNVAGHKPTALLVVDHRKLTEAQITKLEEALYGSETKEAYLPLPDEIATLLATNGVSSEEVSG